MSTLDNLKEAFAGESQANRKYLAFGERAENDGFPGIAKLFRAVAAAEMIHAHAHLRAMGGIKDTVDTISHTRKVIRAVRKVNPEFSVLSGFDEYYLVKEELLPSGEKKIIVKNKKTGSIERWVG